MNMLVLLGIAAGLAMDAFAVSIAVSAALRKVSPRQVFRLSYHFGLFQALMPIIGWWGGRSVASAIVSWDHWAACGLLTAIGVKALREAMQKQEDGAPSADPTRGLSLVSLSVATSIDALAIGVTFAFLRVHIWQAAAVIGIVAAAATMMGMMLGSRIGERFGKRMEALGGLVLIGIGLKILLEHTL